MARISERINGIAGSPIRKLTPLADAAKARGVAVYHLNIGQPDIRTPQAGLDALKDIRRTVLEYSPSQGFLSLREKISSYYAGYGMRYSPDEIIITTGGSEAVLFSFLTCLDPGDEIITTDPTYANYIAFAAAAGVKVRTVLTRIEDNFALPEAEEFEKLISPSTKAILICNPNNPSGSLYSPDEMRRLADIVRRHDLFLLSDEVYREFIYGDACYMSAGHLDGIGGNVVILDSFSKRYSETLPGPAESSASRSDSCGSFLQCRPRVSGPCHKGIRSQEKSTCRRPEQYSGGSCICAVRSILCHCEASCR